MEQVEQLLLEQAVGPIEQIGADLAAMRGNLAALGLGRLLESAEIALLLRTAGTASVCDTVVDPQPI